jgi:hypothetical protein
MRLTWRDGLATLLVAGAVALYGLWVTDTAMTGVSTRLMTVVVFGLGIAACTANRSEFAEVYGVSHERPRPPMAYVVLSSAAGAVMLAAGIIALVIASGAMLATLTAAMAVLWLAATARHALAGGQPHLRVRPSGHAH